MGRVSDHLLSALATGRGADVIVRVAGQEFALHSFVLETYPFFAALLSGPWKDSGVVDLHHDSARSFDLMLNFIYLEEIKFRGVRFSRLRGPCVESVQDVRDLFVLADFLQLGDFPAYMDAADKKGIVAHLMEDEVVVATNKYGFLADVVSSFPYWADCAADRLCGWSCTPREDSEDEKQFVLALTRCLEVGTFKIRMKMVERIGSMKSVSIAAHAAPALVDCLGRGRSLGIAAAKVLRELGYHAVAGVPKLRSFVAANGELNRRLAASLLEELEARGAKRRCLGF